MKKHPEEWEFPKQCRDFYGNGKITQEVLIDAILKEGDKLYARTELLKHCVQHNNGEIFLSLINFAQNNNLQSLKILKDFNTNYLVFNCIS